MSLLNDIDTKFVADMDFIRISAGTYIIGSVENDPFAFPDEHPHHEIALLNDFWCARFPLTNYFYKIFVLATGYVTNAEKEGWGFVWNSENSKWERAEGASWRNIPDGLATFDDKEDFPVVLVSFFDALAYVGWLNHVHSCELPKGYHFSLPNEVEWEMAARGKTMWRYPWGNEFQTNNCNWNKSPGNERITKVGVFSPDGDSIFGCVDMAGNIWEWTRTLWGADRKNAEFYYPYDAEDGRERLDAGPDVFRVIRGGSFKNDQRAVRSACRDIDPPNYSLNNLGFRVFIVPK